MRYLCGILEELLDEREEILEQDAIEWRGWRPLMKFDMLELNAVP
jgi:hypothetical protein